MRLDDFRRLIDRLVAEVPRDFLDGIAGVEVRPGRRPDPVHAGVYTLGECVPLEWSPGGADLQSRVILYYGSFDALARQAPGFDWRGEAWETLTHELRHHLEWRANDAALEAYDWAGEQNFARHEGKPFDPVFYRSGERRAPGAWQVDDDFFLELPAQRKAWGAGAVAWHGRRYGVRIDPPAAPPVFVTLEGVADAPDGDLVAVVPRRASLLDLGRRTPPALRTATAEPLDA